MNYRMYTFTNMYLSDIQKGIQSAHCITDMLVKYDKPFNTFFKECSSPKMDMLNWWMKKNKTMIVMNGGSSGSLMDLYDFFDNARNECIYPFALFIEDEYSLNEALTCVGILLPERIYEGARMLRIDKSTPKSGWNIFKKHSSVLDRLKDTKCMNIPNKLLQKHETSTNAYNNFEIDLMLKLNEYKLA